MGNIKVAIHQPNFMPWLGYFYKMWQTDIFIFLDDVQFPKKGASYINRVSININGKSAFLTIPVKRKEGTWNINETTFSNNKWKKKIISTLQANYAKSEHFKSNRDFIFNLLNYETDNLSEYNIHFVTEVAKKIGIKVDLKNSSDYNIISKSTEKLIALTKSVKGNTYISGKGGDCYQDKTLYENSGVNLIYNNFKPFKHKQLNTADFIHGLSIVDAIFNIGFVGIKEHFQIIDKEA